MVAYTKVDKLRIAAAVLAGCSKQGTARYYSSKHDVVYDIVTSDLVRDELREIGLHEFVRRYAIPDDLQAIRDYTNRVKKPGPTPGAHRPKVELHPAAFNKKPT